MRSCQRLATHTAGPSTLCQSALLPNCCRFRLRLEDSAHVACTLFCRFTEYGAVQTCIDMTPQVKVLQRYALLLCVWVTAVSAVSYPSLGETQALAAAGNGSLSAGQSLGQVCPAQAAGSYLPQAPGSVHFVQCTQA